jgi:hypothetical protein
MVTLNDGMARDILSYRYLDEFQREEASIAGG